LEGLGARDGGLWWPRRGEGRPAADWSAAAAFPAGLGGGEQVGEHQRSMGELSGGSVGREEGRRDELRGGLGRGGANGVGGGSGRRERLGPALGAGRGVEGEVESSLVKQMEGTREGRG